MSSQRPGARIPEAAGLPWDVTGTSFVRKPRPNGVHRPASFHESLPQLREPRGCKHTGQGQGAFPYGLGTGGGEGGGPAITAGSGLPSPIRKPRPWEQESHSSRPFLSISPSGPLLHSFSSSGGEGRGGEVPACEPSLPSRLWSQQPGAGY